MSQETISDLITDMEGLTCINRDNSYFIIASEDLSDSAAKDKIESALFEDTEYTVREHEGKHTVEISVVPDSTKEDTDFLNTNEYTALVTNVQRNV